jgi:N-methylhydantoinase A
VRIPTLDLQTIGAGGGSIAWADPGGLLKVGPHSAGATPGPALYGLGGEDATVTDANVVLGRLSGGALIGGAMTVYPEKSYEAVARLGEKIELDPIATAAGIIEIVNVNMMGAVRAVSIEKGEDPRHYALAAFGGAGPLHAAGVAAEMGMDTVVIPTRPGILSALGLLDADVRGDFSITRLVALTLENTAALRDGAVDLMARGAAWRVAERLNEDSVEISWTADLRYIGQAFELMAPILTLSGTPDFDEATLAALRAEFHRQHASINGYAMEGHAVEMVNLRLSVAAIRPSAGGVEILGDGADVEETIRPVWFPETGFVETPVRDRASLTPGQRIAGPMIVEQMDTTLVIPPAATAIVQPSGDLTLHLGGTQT